MCYIDLYFLTIPSPYICSVRKLYSHLFELVIFKISPSCSIWASPSKLDKENKNRGPVNTQPSPIQELLKAEAERKRMPRRPFSPAFEVIKFMQLLSFKNLFGNVCSCVVLEFNCCSLETVIQKWGFRYKIMFELNYHKSKEVMVCRWFA